MSPFTPSSEQIETFWRDGVVSLPGAMPLDWLERMAPPIDRLMGDATMNDMTAFGEMMVEAAGAVMLVDEEVRAGADGAERRRGRFFAGTDHWVSWPEFRAFAEESPLPQLAAALLDSRQINLYEDSVLVKEPGTQEPTAFHQDMGYFHFDGRQACTFWVPLDHVVRSTGAVGYVIGSHEWARDFKPNIFVSQMPLPDTQGEQVPDIDHHPEGYEIRYFEVQPGDIVVHHARTLHGGGGNQSMTQRRRAISVRYTGDDCRFKRKVGAPEKPWMADAHDGEVLDRPECPVVWPRSR